MKKHYSIDTCCLMESDNTVEVLRNGEENEINIPITVINELDGLMKNPQKRKRATKVVKNILEHKDYINFIGDKEQINNNDDRILKNIKDLNDDESTLVTNDLILQLKSYIHNIKSEEYKKANPFEETNDYTGFIDYYNDEKFYNNCFYFKRGKLFHYNNNEQKCIDYEHNIWKVTPSDVYQNSAMEMLMNDKINIKTIQSGAGTGKTYLALAAGLKQVFEKKKFKKLIIVKYPIGIGEDLGFLPGTISEKMEPFWKPIYKLILKLNDKRTINKGLVNPDDILPELNPRFIEFMPINYIRGDNIEHSFVLIDEAQNIDRNDMRTILTRMGENVNVVLVGDNNQIDNPRCDNNNNGLNWVSKLMKGDEKFAHLHMKTKKTRGPICDMVQHYKL